MGKFYENLLDLKELIKKMDKKDLLPIFIISCIQIARSEPNLTVHEVLKLAKKKHEK